jgi:hypothetical protein
VEALPSLLKLVRFPLMHDPAAAVESARSRYPELLDNEAVAEALDGYSPTLSSPLGVESELSR